MDAPATGDPAAPEPTTIEITLTITLTVNKPPGVDVDVRAEGMVEQLEPGPEFDEPPIPGIDSEVEGDDD